MAGKVNIGKAHVQLTADAGDLNKVVTNAEGRVKGLAKTATEASRSGMSLSGFGKGLLGIGAVASASVLAGLGTLVNQIVKIGNEADNVADTADVLGLTADQLAAFRLRAGGADAFDKSFERFMRSISDAKSGSKEAVQAFKSLGLSAEALDMMTPAQAWLAFIGAMERMPNTADKVDARMTLLGKGSAVLADKIAKGSEAWLRDVDRMAGTQGPLRGLADAVDEAEHSVDTFKATLGPGLAGSTFATMHLIERFIGDFQRLRSAVDDLNPFGGTAAGAPERIDRQQRNNVESLRRAEAEAHRRSKQREQEKKLADQAAEQTKRIADERARMTDRVMARLEQGRESMARDIAAPGGFERGSAQARSVQVQMEREAQMAQARREPTFGEEEIAKAIRDEITATNRATAAIAAVERAVGKINLPMPARIP